MAVINCDTPWKVIADPLYHFKPLSLHVFGKNLDVITLYTSDTLDGSGSVAQTVTGLANVTSKIVNFNLDKKFIAKYFIRVSGTDGNKAELYSCKLKVMVVEELAS